MTDHTDVPIIVTGDWIDAAWINLYIGDNVRAWRQAYTAAGAMAYAVDGNTLGELPITNGGLIYGLTNRPWWLAPPAGDGVLTHPGGASSPAWLAIGAALKVLRVNAAGDGFEFATPTQVVDVSGYAERSTTFEKTGDTNWTDVTGLSITLALTQTCTVRAWLNGRCYATNAAGGGPTGEWRIMIDGIEQTAGTEPAISGNYNGLTPIGGFWRRPGIAAGNRIVKVQVRITQDTGEVVGILGNLFAEAIRE